MMPGMMHIMEVRNAAAWSLPDYRILVALAFERNAPIRPVVAIDELTAWTGHDKLCVLVGRDEGSRALTALAMMFKPSSAFAPNVSLYHFFSRGSPELRDALAAAVVAKAQESGYTAIETVNQHTSDRAFERVFGSVAKLEKVGSLYRFHVGAGHDGRSQ